MILKAIFFRRCVVPAHRLFWVTSAIALCGLVEFVGPLAAQAQAQIDRSSGSSTNRAAGQSQADPNPEGEKSAQAVVADAEQDENRARSIRLLLRDLAACRERGDLLETALRDITTEMRAACEADREAFAAARLDLQNCRADERQNRTTNRRINEELIACRKGVIESGPNIDNPTLEAENTRLQKSLTEVSAERDAALRAAHEVETRLLDVREELRAARAEIERLRDSAQEKGDGGLDGGRFSEAHSRREDDDAEAGFAFATGDADSSLVALAEAGRMLSPARRPSDEDCVAIHEWLSDQGAAKSRAPLVWVWQGDEAMLCAGLLRGRVRVGPGSSYDEAYVIRTR